MWRRRETEPPPLDRRTVDDMIRMLMEINAKLDRLLGETTRTMATKIEPTPEDFERAEESIKHAHRNMLEHLARSEAIKRIEKERIERRRARLRRLTLGLLGR